jgi:hypothetical protein
VQIPVTFARLRSRSAATVAVSLLLVLLLLGFDLHQALLARVDVPFVDGWPVLHRIMLFENGEMSWRRYLMGLHGAHLHSLIYFITLLDFRWLGGQQELQTALSLLSIAAYTLLIAGLMVREGLQQQRGTVEIALCAAAAAALISGLSDTESLLIPFQMVLTLSRLVFVGLLYALCVAILRNRPGLYAATLAAAVPAVTFHGTGHLFAVCIILVHLLLRQRPARLALACLPLLCAVAVQSYYSAGGGELANIGQVLKPAALVEVPMAFAAYFASPFVAYLHIVDNRWLLLPGALLAVSTTVLTLLGLRAVLGLRGWAPAAWWRQWRASAPGTATTHPGVVLFTILGLLLLMSGAAAALFWFIRGAAAQVAPWVLVFDATRYNAYTTLAVLMPLAAWLHRRRATREAVGSAWASLAALAVLVLGLVGTLRMVSLNQTDDRINISTAAISVGLTPIVPKLTDEIWPTIGQDWFWRDQLPRTVAWLRQTQRGPWRDLPALHTLGGPAYAGYQLNPRRWDPMPAEIAPGWCQLSATVAGWGRDLTPRSALVPLVTAGGDVAGYGVLTRRSAGRASREVQGVTGCDMAGTALFVARDETR